MTTPPDQPRLDGLDDQANRRRTSIAVLGAGISGLVAAYELARRGHRVVLFEASGRIGGRVLTHRFGDEHAELGAMRIPGSHRYTRAYCTLLGLALEPFANQDRNTLYRVRGRTVPASDQQTLAELYGLPPGRLPRIVLTLLIQRMLEDLDPDDRAHIVSGDIAHASHRVKALDNCTIRDFALDALDDRADVELLGDVFYLKHVWNASCIALLREVCNDRTTGLSQIVGGTSLLTEGLTQLIRRRYRRQVLLRTGTPVVAISVPRRPGAGVAIRYRGRGRERTETFETALCTIPFPVLRSLKLDGFAAGKLTAIDRYHYAPSTKVALNYSRRFWETLESPIFGGCSVTDQIAGQIFYPTHNDTAIGHPAPDAGMPAVLPGPAAIEAGAPANTRHRSPGPGVLLGSYSWGTDADRLAAMDPEARIQAAQRCVRELHGRIADKYFEGGASMAWGNHRWFAGAFLQPGSRQLQLHRGAAMRPEGRLYFSGDHLSPDPGWLNGAIGSTRAALLEMLREIDAA